jgi:hypothetical protein
MSRLHVPSTHTEMDGTYYGNVCPSCKRQARWCATCPPISCFVAWDLTSQKAVEGCTFASLDEHDKQVCREIIAYLNGAKLEFNNLEHVCYVP